MLDTPFVPRHFPHIPSTLSGNRLIFNPWIRPGTAVYYSRNVDEALIRAQPHTATGLCIRQPFSASADLDPWPKFVAGTAVPELEPPWQRRQILPHEELKLFEAAADAREGRDEVAKLFDSSWRPAVADRCRCGEPGIVGPQGRRARVILPREQAVLDRDCGEAFARECEGAAVEDIHIVQDEFQDFGRDRREERVPGRLLNRGWQVQDLCYT